MARIKTLKETSIKDWQQADNLIGKIGELQRRITIVETAANEQIDAIKAGMKAEIEPINNEIKLLSCDLELFADTHKSDFGKSKSRRLNFGLIGYRQSTKITCGKNAIGLIKEIFGRTAGKYLAVKETVSKEALKVLTDDDLRRIECKRVVSESFFVEPEIIEAAD